MTGDKWFLDIYTQNHRIVYTCAEKGIQENNIQGVTADDLSQEAFILLYDSRDKIRGNPRINVTGWLVLVVQNKLGNLIKKRKLFTQSFDELVELGGAFEAWLAAEDQQKKRSSAARMELYNNLVELVGLADTELLLQRFIDKKTIREIAKEHDTTEEAMQKRINRMVHKIRNHVNYLLFIVICVWFWDIAK